MVSWLVGAVLAAWFLITIPRNLPSLRVAFARHDAARLIPDWALFGRPRTADIILLRRDLLRDGTLTGWREVEVARPRRWYNFIWNPELGPRRAFLSLGTILVANARRTKRPAGDVRGQGTPAALTVMAGVPYLTILRCLSEQSHPAVDATQFMIMAVEDQAITGRYVRSGPASTDPSGPASTDPSGPASTDPSGPASTDPSGPASTDPSGPANIEFVSEFHWVRGGEPG
jgi:hypothetical protein